MVMVKVPVKADGLNQENFRVVPAIGKPMARVTTVLGFNPKGDGSALEKWRAQWTQDNPEIINQCKEMGIDPDKFHAWRGTQVHACLEAALAGEVGEHADHPWVKPFWDKLRPDIEAGRFQRPIWSEGPLPTYDWPDIDLSFDRNGKTCYHIWSEQHGYVGTPDLVCTFGTMQKRLTLFDLKTSAGLYSKKSPSSGGTNRGGYFKYLKTMTQLAMYDMAFTELLGVQLEQWAIIVLPECSANYQLFTLTSQQQMQQFREKAIEKIRIFREHHPDLTQT
jgi:hypothetical protein